MNQARISLSGSLVLPFIELAMRVQRAVKEYGMDRVDAAIDCLDKVVLLIVPRDETVRFRNPAPLKFRQLRGVILVYHRGRENPRFLPHGIGSEPDIVLESARRIFRRHVDASSFDVVLPT